MDREMQKTEFSKNTMNRFKKQRNTIQSYVSSIRNIFTNIERFKWSHSDMLVEINSFRNEKSYHALPKWAKEYLNGVQDQLQFQIEQKQVYAYYVNDEFLPIDSEKFRKIKPQTISELYSDFGAFVWRDDVSKVWYGYEITK